jgi:hypothetical protein
LAATHPPAITSSTSCRRPRRGATPSQRRSGLPIESPLVFYPRRAAEQAATVARWLSLYARYRRIMKRVAADPATANHTDEALRVTDRKADEQAEFVQAFADVMPATHGTPVHKAVAAE